MLEYWYTWYCGIPGASALGIMMEMAHICISSAAPPGRRGNCAIHYAHHHHDDGEDGDGAGNEVYARNKRTFFRMFHLCSVWPKGAVLGPLGVL